MSYNQVPVATIFAALEHDENAIRSILRYYRKLIRTYATEFYRNKKGEYIYVVDEELLKYITQRLLVAIVLKCNLAQLVAD